MESSESEAQISWAFENVPDEYDIGFSINDGIISMSRYYHFNMIITLFLGLLMIGSDTILIPRYGLIGAATALLLVFTFHGLFKLILLKRRKL